MMCEVELSRPKAVLKDNFKSAMLRNPRAGSKKE
jgi:hypothetical protein